MSPKQPSKRIIALVGTALLAGMLLMGLYIWEAVLHSVAPETKTETLLATPDAVPAVTPQIILLRNQMRGLAVGHKELVPLGGVSRTATIYCREAGDLISYRSDRHGFRNNDALWDSPIDVVAIGDSYTQGSCVHDDEHMVGVIRSKYPGTLNLGSFGNGPLANLGVLSEYAIPMRPKTVLWFYVANDMSMDTLLESGSPVLRNYMRPGFTQHLRQRQKQIDTLLRPFLQTETQKQATEEHKPSWLSLDLVRKTIRTATFRTLRPPAPDLPAESDYDRQSRLNYAEHAIMIATAAERARQVGADFHFVIIPDARMLRENVPASHDPQLHVVRLAKSIRSMGVPVINVYDFVRDQEKPLGLYAALDGYYGHFNVAGYKRVGDFIAKEVASHQNRISKQP